MKSRMRFAGCKFGMDLRDSGNSARLEALSRNWHWVLPMLVLIAAIFAETSRAQDKQPATSKQLSKSERLAKASRKLTEKRYRLQYRFKPEEVVYWQTEQVDNGEVSLRKKKEVTRSRTLSTKKWRVAEIDAQGNTTVVQSIVDVDLWQQIDNLPAISYNSRTDATPHLKFEAVADTVGIELVNFKFDRHGNLIFKKANYADIDLGVGGIIVAFPEEPIGVGDHWFRPGELKVALPTGQIKTIKIRRRFTLLDVQHQVAKISVQTQVLTPIHDPEVEVQIMHQVTEGTLRFDIKLGRIISREFNWNRKVQGFSTADSLKKYVGRFRETIRSAEDVRLAAEATVKDAVVVRTINEGPIFRR